jgi:hypothetical protein
MDNDSDRPEFQEGRNAFAKKRHVLRAHPVALNFPVDVRAYGLKHTSIGYL